MKFIKPKPNIEFTRPVPPGGVFAGDFSSEHASEAMQECVSEFRKRAILSGNMELSKSSIILGELLDFTEQIVAGTLFAFTMELGVTTNPKCKRLSQRMMVSYKLCPDADKMAVVELSVTFQVWNDPQFIWLVK